MLTRLGNILPMKPYRAEIYRLGAEAFFAKVAAWFTCVTSTWSRMTISGRFDDDGRLTVSDPSILGFVGAQKPFVLAYGDRNESDWAGRGVSVVAARNTAGEEDALLVVWEEGEGGKPLGAFLYDRANQMAYYYRGERAVNRNEQIYVLVMDQKTRRATVNGITFYQAVAGQADLWFVRFENGKYVEARNIVGRPPTQIQTLLDEDGVTVIGYLFGRNAAAPFQLGVSGFLGSPLHVYPLCDGTRGRTFIFPSRGKYSVTEGDFARWGTAPEDGVRPRLRDGCPIALYPPRGPLRAEEAVYYKLAYQWRPAEKAEELGRFSLEVSARRDLKGVSFGGLWLIENARIFPQEVRAGITEAKVHAGRNFAVFSAPNAAVSGPSWPEYASVLVMDGARKLLSFLSRWLTPFQWELAEALAGAVTTRPTYAGRLKKIAAQVNALQEQNNPEARALLEILKVFGQKGKLIADAELGEGGAVFLREERALRQLGASAAVPFYRDGMGTRLTGKNLAFHIIDPPAQPIAVLLLCDKTTGAALCVFYFDKTEGASFFLHPKDTTRKRYCLSFSGKEEVIFKRAQYVRRNKRIGATVIVEFRGDAITRVLDTSHTPIMFQVVEPPEGGRQTVYLGVQEREKPSVPQEAPAPKPKSEAQLFRERLKQAWTVAKIASPVIEEKAPEAQREVMGEAALPQSPKQPAKAILPKPLASPTPVKTLTREVALKKISDAARYQGGARGMEAEDLKTELEDASPGSKEEAGVLERSTTFLAALSAAESKGSSGAFRNGRGGRGK